MKEYSQKYSAIKMREYRAKNPEKHLAYPRDYRKRNPDKARGWDFRGRLMKKYGLSMPQFNELLSAQKGLCACCNQQMILGGQKSLSVCVDHDHKTGKVRELLCAGCNVAIAHLGEDPARCEKAAAYLRKHQTTK